MTDAKNKSVLMGLASLGFRGKEVKIQGVSVRATRNPKPPPRLPEVFLSRWAERSFRGLLFQEPPRSTRQPPDSHALPSVGAPS